MDRHARRKLLADIRELAQGDEGLRGHLRLARWTAVMPLDDRAAYLRNLEELLEDAGDGAYKIARASDALSEEFGPQLRLDSPDGRERELGVALAKAGSDLGIAEGKVNRALDGVADAINALADHHGIRMASSRAARDEPLAMSRETFFRLTGLDADDWGIAERGADVYVWPGGTARTTLPGGRDVTLSGPGYVSPTTLKAVARAYDQATRRGLYAGYARAPGRIARDEDAVALLADELADVAAGVAELLRGLERAARTAQDAQDHAREMAGDGVWTDADATAIAGLRKGAIAAARTADALARETASLSDGAARVTADVRSRSLTRRP